MKKRVHLCLDGRIPWKGNLKLRNRLCNLTGCKYGSWFHGSLCHCQNEMETGKDNDDLFHDWYDDSGTLCTDSTV